MNKLLTVFVAVGSIAAAAVVTASSADAQRGGIRGAGVRGGAVGYRGGALGYRGGALGYRGGALGYRGGALGYRGVGWRGGYGWRGAGLGIAAGTAIGTALASPYYDYGDGAPYYGGGYNNLYSEAPAVSAPAVSTTIDETAAATHPVLDPELHGYCMSRTFNAGPC